MSQEKTVGVGVSFAGLLTVLFIGLKLTGYITWSWLWILAPIWAPVALGIAILIFILIAMGIYKASN